MPYNREAAVQYAHRWAYGRNPSYLSFNGIGGDCTNFISQCLYAGGAPMNYKPTFGWYYKNGNNKSPSWTAVQHLYTFLTTNQSTGPYGEPAELRDMRPGDIIQLSFTDGLFSHSLIVVSAVPPYGPGNILIASHSYDSDNRPLNTYQGVRARRPIKLLGARD